ncbi:MAG: hypothetical protein M1835_007758 [Candelina submexicana]|nr:MAG: hypothetical protein M1835_007758 [Candelina submexicana]
MPTRTLPQAAPRGRPFALGLDEQNNNHDDECAIIDDDKVEYVGFGLMPSVILTHRTGPPTSLRPLHQAEQGDNVVEKSDRTAIDSPEVTQSPRQALLAAVEKFFMPQLTSPAPPAQHAHSRNSSACTITPNAHAHPHDSMSSGSYTSSTPSRSSFLSVSSYERQPEQTSDTRTSCEHQKQVWLQGTPIEAPYYLQPSRYTPGMYDNYYKRSSEGVEGDVSFNNCHAQWDNGSAFPSSRPAHGPVHDEHYSKLEVMATPTATQVSGSLDQRRSSLKVSSQDVRFTGIYGHPTSYPDTNEGGPLVSTGPAFRAEGTERTGPNKAFEHSSKRQSSQWKPAWNSATHPRSFEIDTRGFCTMGKPPMTFTAESLAEAVSIGPLESVSCSPSPIPRTAFTVITFVSENDATTFWRLVTEAYKDDELLAFEASRESCGGLEGERARQVHQKTRMVKDGAVPETAMTLMQSSGNEGQLFIDSKLAIVTRMKMDGGHDRAPNRRRISKTKRSTRIVVFKYLSPTPESAVPNLTAQHREIPTIKERANLNRRYEHVETSNSQPASKPLRMGFQGEHDLRADIENIFRPATIPKASTVVPTSTDLITKFEVFGAPVTPEPRSINIQNSGSNIKSWADQMDEHESAKGTILLCLKGTEDVQHPPNLAEGLPKNASRRETGATTVVVHFANVADAIQTKDGLIVLPKYRKSCNISFGRESLITAKQFREQRLRQACDHLSGKISDLRVKKAER